MDGYDPAVDVPTFVWMFVVLKIPIIAALLLIWYAIKEQPEPSVDEDDGGSRVPMGTGPRPYRPRHPRRGPHAAPPVSPPDRIRATQRGSHRRPARR